MSLLNSLYSLTSGVPVAFHHGANSCRIKKIIQERLYRDAGGEGIDLEALLPLVEDEEDSDDIGVYEQ